MPFAEASATFLSAVLLPVLVEDALGAFVVAAVVMSTGSLVGNGQNVGDYNGVVFVPTDEDAAGFSGQRCPSQLGAVGES